MAISRHDLQAGFRLGDCLIQPSQNRIQRGHAEVRVEPRVMEVLLCLAERAGEVVSRDSIYQEVWGPVVVTDQAVTNCISELRHHLGDDRTANRLIETIPKRGYRLVAPVQLAGTEPPTGTPSSSRLRTAVVRGWPIAGGLLLVAAVLGVVWWLRDASGGPAPTSVAVLSFENEAGDARLDYLRLAFPDEIATLLSRSQDLAVRPFQYLDAQQPLVQARARQVGHLVSGRYYLEDDNRLTLAVEAHHVAQERVVWRARITAPADDLVTMRERVAQRVHQGLLPALGAAAGPAFGPRPVHDEAYQLYLRSLALPKRPAPTERAIGMLERAVQLDPDFAPAWDALGFRYYDHGTYGSGGEQARAKSVGAHRKALARDPGLRSAARRIVAHHVEAGELEAAYEEAYRLLERFGDSAETHFALAYVYRFGGMLDESQRRCRLALDLDPHDPTLRSCAYSFLYAGKLSPVTDFLELDPGSYFVHWATVLYHLRRGDDAAALEAARQVDPEPTRQLMEPCLQGVRGEDLDAAVAAFLQHWQPFAEPEMPYALAPMLAYCGHPEPALRLLEEAVDRNFCSYPALDQDPIWTGLRDHPEFQRIRSKAMACHDRFRRMVAAHSEGAGDQPR